MSIEDADSRAHGARFVLTPAKKGMKALESAELVTEMPNAWSLRLKSCQY
jgi:hypothetical protein